MSVKINQSVSLIIPTYRREESLVRCLRSAVAQKYSPLEIIVVDQTESHDNDTIKYLGSEKSSIKLIEHSPPSAVTARNCGLKEAQGEIIIFIDDDTTFEPDFVGSHVAAHRNGADVVQGRVIEPGRGVSYRAQWMLPWLRVIGSNTYDKTSHTNTITGCNFSISQATSSHIGEFDTRFSGVLIREDADYGARCYKAGLKMVFDADACVTHHRDPIGGVDSDIKAASRILEPSYLRNELYFARKHFNKLVVWQYKWRLRRRINRNLLKLRVKPDVNVNALLQQADREAKKLLNE